MGLASSRPRRSRWRILLYPVAGIVVADLLYQFVVAWHQAHVIARARPDFLLLAVLNQLAVYVVLVPAMQGFYAAAKIRLSGRRVFALLATGLAMARIIPAGEYVVWRTGLSRFKGGVSATTQWLIMYYTWMFSALVALFMVAEVVTLLTHPNAHAKTLVGNLRFLPIGLSFIFLVVGFTTRLRWVRDAFKRLAFDKFGSQAVSPSGIISDRKLGRGELGTLTFASLSTWLIEGFTLYLCLRAVGLQVPIVTAVFGFTFARLFAMLPLTPGGIGVIETGSVLFFVAYSYPVGPVFTATVLYRLITYWPPLLVGGITYIMTNNTSPDAGWLRLNSPVFASQLHKR